MKAVLWELNLVMHTGKIRKEKIGVGGRLKRKWTVAKEIRHVLQCLIRNRTQLVTGPATEPFGGVGGQLGPGEVVTTVPGPGAPALEDGSMGPGVRQTQVQVSATCRCVLG